MRRMRAWVEREEIPMSRRLTGESVSRYLDSSWPRGGFEKHGSVNLANQKRMGGEGQPQMNPTLFVS